MQWFGREWIQADAGEKDVEIRMEDGRAERPEHPTPDTQPATEKPPPGEDF